MKIKVEPFLRKQGNKVAVAAIEFDSDNEPLSGYLLRGFTICEDENKELFVLFPAATNKSKPRGKQAYFFLIPKNNDGLDRLSNAILDIYENIVGKLVSK